MQEEFGPNIVVLTDDDGVDHEFEHLDTIEFNGELYMAFVPADISEEADEPVELAILRVTRDENGEEILETVDDEETLEAVFNVFLEDAEDEDEE